MPVSFLCPQCGKQSDFGAKPFGEPPGPCMACTFLASGPTLPARLPDEGQLDAEAERLMRLRQIRTILECAMTAMGQLCAWPWEDVVNPATSLAITEAVVAAARTRNMVDNDIVRAERRFPYLPPTPRGGQ